MRVENHLLRLAWISANETRNRRLEEIQWRTTCESLNTR